MAVRPGAVAHSYRDDYISTPDVRTFAALQASANELAQGLLRGCESGVPVVVVMPSTGWFLPTLAACFRLRVPVVPLAPPRVGMESAGAEWVLRIVTLCGARRVVTLAAVREVLIRSEPFRSSGIEIHAVDESIEREVLEEDGLERRDRPGAEDVALILFTSGSTGAPKGVVLRHSNLVENIGAFVVMNRLGPEDATVTWLPNFHIAGLYTRLLGWFSGAPTVEFPAALFLGEPLFWPRVISECGATVSAAPNFAYDLLAAAGAKVGACQDLELSRWRLAISGGEVVRSGTLCAMQTIFSCCGFRGESMAPYYGLTETLCSAMSGGRMPRVLRMSRLAMERNRVQLAEAEEDNAVELVSNGGPFGGTRLMILECGRLEPAQDGVVGEIAVSGPAVTPGYWGESGVGDPNRGSTRVGAEGREWLRTGDLGFVHEGELYVTGRLKEMIIVRGKNLYPADLEASIMRRVGMLGVNACAALAIEKQGEETVGIVLELQAGREPDRALEDVLSGELQAALVCSFGIRAGSWVVIAKGGLPRTTTGKVQRRRCMELFAHVTYRESYDANASGVGQALSPQVGSEQPERLKNPYLETVREEIAVLLGCEAGSVDIRRSLPALGVDSLGMVRLLMALERRLGFAVGVGTLLTSSSVESLASGLRSTSEVGRVVVDWREDLERFRAILERGGDNPRRGKSNLERCSIFLTGATGFLGAYLLRDCLLHTDMEVRCLVRGESEERSRQRLLAKWRGLGEWREEWDRRVHVVSGTLEAPRFGLSDGEFEALAGTVAVVVHNGANVNFVAPYSLLRAVNVGSNATVLELSLAAGQVPVHYISTTAVFNGEERDQFDPLTEEIWLSDPSCLFSGYAQTKWVGEALWREGGSRGIKVSIHRPGLVTGDSGTGDWHTDDFLCRLFQGCVQMGVFPDLGVEIDMMPVDLVSRGIVEVLMRERYGDVRVCNYHWTHPTPAKMSDIAVWFRCRGWAVELASVDRWLERVRTVKEDNALYPLMPFLFQRLGTQGVTLLEFFGSRRLNLGRSNAAQVLEDSSIQPPEKPAALMELYVNALVSKGILPRPDRHADR